MLDDFTKWCLNESDSSRYSVGVNYRTKKQDVLEAYAKIALGYVSAAMKNSGYHTKHVYNESPLRLIVSTRNWDDGEWVGVLSWNETNGCFVISSGYWNKSRSTVSIQTSTRCKDDNSAELTKELFNLMESLKNKPSKVREKLNPVTLKRGPKS
jgi:hypothetical protein